MKWLALSYDKTYNSRVYIRHGTFLATSLSSVNASPPEKIVPYDHGMTDIHACVNNDGIKVKFIATASDAIIEKGSFLALATELSEDQTPAIFYDAEILPMTDHKFQNWVLLHECAHHELGHIDGISPPSQEAKEEEENAAECHSVSKLRTEFSYTKDDISLVNAYIGVLFQDIVHVPAQKIEDRQNYILACYDQATPE